MSENIEMVKTIAHRLGELRDEVVFLGGAVTALLISDAAAGEVRPTKDVDVMPPDARLLGFGRKTPQDLREYLAKRFRDLLNAQCTLCRLEFSPPARTSEEIPMFPGAARAAVA